MNDLTIFENPEFGSIRTVELGLRRPGRRMGAGIFGPGRL